MLYAMILSCVCAFATEYVVVVMNNGTMYRYNLEDIESINVDIKKIPVSDPLDDNIGTTISGKVGSYTYVDLGLPSGTLWATCNVGAVRPEDYGVYLAWGDTESWSISKEELANDVNPWSKYKFYSPEPGEGASFSCTKYNEEDKKFVLDPEDDAATVKWGEDWCMPTGMEMEELQAYTTVEEVENFNNSGVKGYVLTSTINGNTMFIPAGGRFDVSDSIYVGESANLWSSTLESFRSYVSYPVYSCAYYIWRGNSAGYNGLYRNYACNIRPVVKKKKLLANVSGESDNHGYVDMGLPSGTLWATSNIDAETITDAGSFFAWGETVAKKPKNEFPTFYYDCWATYKYCTRIDPSAEIEHPELEHYKFTKYNTTDGLTSLELDDDAAYVNWGENWRMPTLKEFQELHENSHVMWTEDYNGKGIAGAILISKRNGNVMFLPCIGSVYGERYSYNNFYLNMWTSDMVADYNPEYNAESRAASYYFKSYYAHHDEACTKCSGFNIRPVLTKTVTEVGGQ